MEYNMNFKKFNFNRVYRSLGDNNILESFLKPALKHSKEYRRSVGFFTLKAFEKLYESINELVNFNKGTIKLIASPNLTKVDYDIISKAVKTREEIVLSSLEKEFQINYSEFENFKIAEIFKLIVNGIIEIKVAVTETAGMYHDKLGILVDKEDNIITFYGSLNETDSGYTKNYEKIRLSFSWKNEDDYNHVLDEVKEFEKLWDGENEFVKTYTLPEAIHKKIIEFIEYQESNNPYYMELKKREKIQKYRIRPYQNDAIQSWKENGYKGILSMATGTGKTITSLFGLRELLTEKQESMMILIVVPYLILLDQWDEQLRKFGYRAIKASSKNSNWMSDAQDELTLLNYNRIDNLFIVCTIGTFKSVKMQTLLNRVRKNIVFIADEVHNFGAFQTHKFLPEKAVYRLGLSATPKRHFDDFGSEALERYFGGIVYEFDLERAIREKFLVPYEYIPIPTYLTEMEQEKYDEITARIIRLLNIKDEQEIYNSELNSAVEMLLINRARYIATAQEKIPKFFEEFKKVKGESDNLVYCGASFLLNEETHDYDDEVINSQINAVVNGLGKMGVWPGKYISKMSDEEKRFVLNRFKSKKISTLVAIKCLDEGVDIPSIKRAFILASTTNPKEFIQRRGRVLRKEVGKELAYIYDFITLPSKNANFGSGLVIRELKRFYEFMKLSKNIDKVERIFNELIFEYSIDKDLIY